MHFQIDTIVSMDTVVTIVSMDKVIPIAKLLLFYTSTFAH